MARPVLALPGIVSLLAIFAAPARGQQPPSPSSRSSNLVTVRGCVDGRVLTTTDDSGIADSDSSHRLDLTGSKEMMKRVKEHAGHLEEITGVLKNADAAGTTSIKEKQVGSKGRAYVGVGHDDPPPVEAVRPSIQVRDITHLADRCSS